MLTVRLPFVILCSVLLVGATAGCSRRAPAPAAQTRAVDPAREPAAARSAIRTEIGFRTPKHLADHFRKHGSEFEGFDQAAYLEAAQELRDVPAGDDVLEFRRADGVVTRFDRRSGAFLAFDADGFIRTFFKPTDGETYFRRQARRR